MSWFVIEPGWTVVAADGSEIGQIEEVVGDTETDIFNGLVVSTKLLARSKYVPAEQVSEITDGVVRLDLPTAGIESLNDHEPRPPSTGRSRRLQAPQP